MYCRFRLAKLFIACCVEDPYPQEEEVDSDLPVALASWDYDRWIDLKLSLEKLRNTLLRTDAEWVTDESEDIDPRRGDINSKWYHEKLEKILRSIPIQQVLSKFRWTIEEQIRSNEKGQPDVEAEDIAEFV